MTFSPSIYLQSNQINSRKSSVFDPRANLPDRSNILWKIDSGVVRTLTWLEDGTLIILGVWGPGDLVGKALTRINPYQIECLTKVEAIPLPLTGSEELSEMLLNHIRQLDEFTVIRSHKKTDLMILALFSWLSKKFGLETQTGQIINIRLTHQDIAEIMGLTRVTVTRILSQLEQQGLIERLPFHRILLREDAIWHYEI